MDVFVKLIPDWLPAAAVAPAIGKVVTFLAPALVLSWAVRSRTAAPAMPPAPPGN